MDRRRSAGVIGRNRELGTVAESRAPSARNSLSDPTTGGVTSTPHVLLSPDGRKLLINTLGARGPFWSPDSKFVAFGVGNQLKKIDSSGGSPQILCTVQNTVASGAWNREGKIVFGS